MREWDFSAPWDLIDFFDLDKFCTKNKYVEQAVGKNSFIFRGVPSLEYPNEPKAFRKKVDASEFSPEAPKVPFPSSFDDWPMRNWFVGKLSGELRAVQIFLETADRLGLSTSLDYNHLESAFTEIFAFLKKTTDPKDHLAAIGDTPFPPSYLERAFALAQHHGVPTRLLDWTESPTIAAYFAALKASSVVPRCDRHEDGRIAVYFVSHSALPAPWLKMVSAPRHDNDYLRVQRGRFISFPKANAYFLENNEWPTLEVLMEKYSTSGLPWGRATLPVSQADELLRILYDRDIRRETLMPSLGNAAHAFAYRKALFENCTRTDRGTIEIHHGSKQPEPSWTPRKTTGR